MALERLKHPENVPGDFYVDTTCIDCDLCRQIGPETFKDVGDQSVVYRQPATREEQLQALKALVTCPTASIGTKSGVSIKSAIEAYPERVAEEVYFCGFAAESSFGASSYLIIRPEGNVLVDSPRFAKLLVKQIEQQGGIKWMFLTHRDDVADHEKWTKHFNAKRILHSADAGRLRSQIEWLLTGDQPIAIEENLVAVPTPGHTAGHTVLFYRDQFLFSGDHLWWSDHYKSLHASRNVCWYSWEKQVQSVERLKDYRFEWILPGHGRRAHFAANVMRHKLLECIHRIQAPTS